MNLDVQPPHRSLPPGPAADAAPGVLFRHRDRASLGGPARAQEIRAAGSWDAKLALDLTNTRRESFDHPVDDESIVIIISSLISLFFFGQDRSTRRFWPWPLTSPLIVLFGELMPRRFISATRRARALGRPPCFDDLLDFFSDHPPSLLYTSHLARDRPDRGASDREAPHTRDELKTLLSYSKKESEIKPSEKPDDQTDFRLQGHRGETCAIPLVKVDAIEEVHRPGRPSSAIRFTATRACPFSGRIDNIVGVLEASIS